MYNRRGLLKASACSVALAALASCAAFNTFVDTALADAKTYANDLVNALGSALSDVKLLLPADTVNTLTNYYNDLTGYNATLQGVSTTTSGQSTLSFIANLVNKIVAGLLNTSVILPTPIPQILLAAKVILPVIEGLLGIAVVGVVSPSQMTTEQAKSVLHTAAAKYVANGSKI